MLTTHDWLDLAAGSAAVAAAAAGGLAYGVVSPASSLFGAALTAPRNPADGRPEIAFTFDDGPNPAWTPHLLNLLAEHEVKATFFLIGRYSAAERGLVRRIHEAGHLIGNHTWSHPNLLRSGDKSTREEISRTNAELEEILGGPIRYFRPPFGMRRPGTFRIVRELGLIPVTWNVIGNDWKVKSSEEIVSRVTRFEERNRRRGFATNLVLHDGSHREPSADRSRTVAATRTLLARYRQTHRTVTLDAWNIQSEG